MKRILATAAFALAASIASGAGPQKVTIHAKKGAFEPSEITVTAGEPVELTLESTEGSHSFFCKALAVDSDVAKPGKPVTVSFTAKEPGTIDFRCGHFCGFSHGKMKGKIVVIAAAPTPAPPSN